MAAIAASAVGFILLWPPFGAPALALLVLAPLTYAAISAPSARRAFAYGFAAALPGWIWLEAWLWGLTPPGTVALVIFCSSFSGLYGWWVRGLARSRRFGRWPLALLAPIAWCGSEYLRSDLVLGGYGWFSLGLGLLGGPERPGPLGLAASLFGWSFLSAACAATAGLAVDLARLRGAALRGGRGVGALAAVSLPIALAAYGWFRAPAEDPDGPAVVLVQTNLPMSNKLAWAPEDQVRDVREFLRLTLEARRSARGAGLEPDLYVWPETTVPGFGLEPATIGLLRDGGFWPGAIFTDAVADLAAELDRPLLVGSNAYLGLRAGTDRWEWDRQFNSAYLVVGEPPYPRYDKLLLTPFGEEMPLISRWDWLERKVLAFGAPGMTFDLDAGERPVHFEVPIADGRSVRIATPICFEDSVPSVCRTLVFAGGRRTADLLINLSNDGWLLDSQTAREHHVLHARASAIATGTPMLRAANTGLSVAIGADGRVTHRIGEGPLGAGGTAGFLAVRAPLGTGTPLFARVGDLWPMVALGLLILFGLLARFDPLARTERLRGPS